MKTSTYVFKKGMVINCTLKTEEINPRQVNYTWFSCDSESCDKESLGEKIVESPSLRLHKSQSKPQMKYLCRASNAAGSDTTIIDVITVQVISKCDYSNN